MKIYRRLGWSNPRVMAIAVTLGMALFSAATVLAAPQYDLTCEVCHRMPPLDSDSGLRIPSTGAVKGNHSSHAGSTPETCVKCHGPKLSSTGHRDKMIQVSGTINGSLVGEGYQRTFINQTTIPPNPLGTCSGVNCHFEGISPAWGRKPNYTVPGGCSNCHEMAPGSGSHPRHSAYYGGGTDACSKCHPDHSVEPLPFRHATSATNRGIAVSFSGNNSGGTYSGDGKNFLPSQRKSVFGGCSALYCHSDGKNNPPNTPATWGVQLPADCTGCHGGNADSSRTLSTGSHGKHINNANFSSGVNLGSNYRCARCHRSGMDVTSDVALTSTASHVDGTPNVVFSDGGGYANGVCSSTTCHGPGKAGVTAQQAPSWGTGTLDCKGCHGAGSSFGEPTYASGGAGSYLANSHGPKHVTSAASCANCHASTTADGVSIVNGSTTHTDGNLSVNFLGTLDLGGAFYNGAVNAKTCSSTYCHSDGRGGNALEATQWGGKTNCRSCHGGDAASSAPIASLRHRAHLWNYSTTGRGNTLMCAECHAKTVGFDNNTTIINPALHVNVYKDYSGVRAGGSAGYQNGACSNVYCHSSGEATPVFRNMTGEKAWDRNGKLSCNGCHGYDDGPGFFKPVAGEPNYQSQYGKENSHYKHTVGAKMADSRGCAACHRTTVDAGVKDRLRSYSSAHLNGVRDISFGVIANYSGNYSRGSKTCSNTYCHGNGQSAAWGVTGLACDSCHGAGSSLPGLHGSHWQGTGIASNYAAAPGNVTGTAASYNFECSSCHSGAHAQGPMPNGYAAEVFFSYTSSDRKGRYDYGAPAGKDGNLQWSSGKCTNTYCHSKGDGSEGWGSDGMTWTSPVKTLGCNGCHGGDWSKLNPINSGLHKNHLDTVSNPSMGAGNARKCADCHALTVFGNNSTITDKRRHVNKFKDYSGALAGGSTSYSQKYQTCSNFCHSNGKRGAAYEPSNPTPWSQQATLGCNGCHGKSAFPDFASDAFGTPNYASVGVGGDSSNSHKLHMQKMATGTSNVCYACHARTVDKNLDRTLRPYSTLHLTDGLINVSFGSISTASFKLMSSVGKARYSGRTCSTVTCHSNGKGAYTDVKWGAKSDCGMCHPLNKLSRGHAFHIYTSATNTPTFYDNYTANRSTGPSTGSPTPRYNYGCGNCHPLNNPNHMRGPVLIDMTRGPANVVGSLRAKNNASQIYKGSVVAGTTGSGTRLSNGQLFCDNVYCHSNGYATTMVYVGTPDWYNGNFTGDHCAGCHGNAPNSGTVAGSPTHYNGSWLGSPNATGGHILGIHASRITNDINFYGVLSPGSTDPSSHGRTANVTPTTINCNTCHWSVITTSANNSSAQCANCHTLPESSANAFIADKSLHVNGTVSVKFRPTPVYSKAQLKDPSFTAVSSVYWTRPNGYKNPGSYDASKIDLGVSSYAGNGGNCTTVCHFNKPVRWDNNPAAACNSCHTTL